MGRNRVRTQRHWVCPLISGFRTTSPHVMNTNASPIEATYQHAAMPARRGSSGMPSATVC